MTRRALAPTKANPTACRVEHGMTRKTLCTVRVEVMEGEDGSTVLEKTELEFRLSEIYGHSPPPTHGAKASSERRTLPFVPPKESARVDVPEWLTEAALCLQVGGSAEFIAATGSSGPEDRHRVSLLAAAETVDLLGDDGLVLRVLDAGEGGEKPRDLARVRASWRVWFLRSSELILSSSQPNPMMPPPPGGLDDAEEGGAGISRGRDVILDQGGFMVALELAMKEMHVGERACLRVSEHWGHGPLLPHGNPVLKGAAIWVELTLNSLENEPSPGQHPTVEAALGFAVEKKQQGNTHLAEASPAEIGRAIRRYEFGIRTLEALLPPCEGAPSARRKEPTPPSDVVLASDAEKPRVEEALTALQLNAAQANIRSSEWSRAVELCSSVLQRDAENGKARYRRAIARAELGQLVGAVEDLRTAAAANPSDAGIRKELARVEAMHRDLRDEEKKNYGGFFDKMRQKEADKEAAKEAKQKSAEESAAKARAEAAAKRREAAAAYQKGRAEEEDAALGLGEKPAKDPKVSFEPPARAGAEEAAEAPEEAAEVPKKTLSAAEENKKILEPAPVPVKKTEEEKAKDQARELFDQLDAQKQANPHDPANLPSAPPELPAVLRNQSHTTQAPEPIDYQVPSFLRKKAKKPK